MPSRNISILLVSSAVLFVIILALLSSRPTIIEDNFRLSFPEQCRTEATANCAVANTLPPTWSLLRNVTEGDRLTKKSCAQAFPNVQCIARILEGFA